MEAATHEVARNAVRSLRGMRLCSEGHEEGRLTHLVLGQSRRTLKVCSQGTQHSKTLHTQLSVSALDLGRTRTSLVCDTQAFSWPLLFCMLACLQTLGHCDFYAALLATYATHCHASCLFTDV